jgi:hypothetical protein
MQVPYHRLMPTRLFFGVTEGSTTPIGPQTPPSGPVSPVKKKPVPFFPEPRP